MEVRTLRQDNFNAQGLGTYTELEADPSPSDTTLYLNYGQIVGRVRELRSDSNFEIETAVGTAGIRGTGFDAIVEIIGNIVVFTFTNLDGLADLETFNPENIQTRRQQGVNRGQQVVVRATVDDDGNITGIEGITEADVDVQAVTETLQQILDAHTQAEDDQETGEVDEDTGDTGDDGTTSNETDSFVDDDEDVGGDDDEDDDTDTNIPPDQEVPPTNESGTGPNSPFGGIQQ